MILGSRPVNVRISVNNKVKIKILKPYKREIGNKKSSLSIYTIYFSSCIMIYVEASSFSYIQLVDFYLTLKVKSRLEIVFDIQVLS